MTTYKRFVRVEWTGSVGWHAQAEGAGMVTLRQHGGDRVAALPPLGQATPPPPVQPIKLSLTEH